MPPISLKLTVDYKVPSLNRLFAMNHWERAKERKKAHHALWCALSPSDTDFSTRTTSAQNRLLTAYTALALYLATERKTSSCRCAKKSAGKTKKKQKSS